MPWVVVGAGILALLVGCRAEDVDTVVERVIDGDTISVTTGDRTETVRLLNIDTPETVDPNSPVQCLGPEATVYLQTLLPPGTPVRLESDDVATDSYGRVLAGVFLPDGRLVNAEIARQGLGSAMSVEGNDRFLPPVQEAVREAEAAGRGLFAADPACTVAAQLAQLQDAAAVATTPAEATVVADRAGELSASLAAAVGPVTGVFSGQARSLMLSGLATTQAQAQATRDRLQAEIDERLLAEQRAAEEAAAARRAEEQRAEEQRAEEQRAEEQRAEERRAEERRAEEERDRAAAAPRRSEPESRSGGSGSNPYPGYTGPRCYAPGGRTWRPC